MASEASPEAPMTSLITVPSTGLPSLSNRYMMVFEGSNASSRPAGSAGTREVDTRAATMRERFGSAGAMTAGILRRGPGDLLNSPADETRCLLVLQEKNIWRAVASVGVVSRRMGGLSLERSATTALVAARRITLRGDREDGRLVMRASHT